MELVFTLVICILISFLFSLLAKKAHLSVVIGLIVAGIILGVPLFKEIVLGENIDFILKIGNVGFFALMFLAGMEVSWSMLFKQRKKAVLIASFAFFTPFFLGFIVFLMLGFSLMTSLVVGICMSITAEATKARVLIEYKKLKTKLGSIMMGAGIIDDILGIFLFILLNFWLSHSFGVKEFINSMGAIIVFFIGIGVHKFFGREKRLVSFGTRFLLFFIVPFFFISMGINFSFKSIILDPKLLLIILGIAISGKIFGCLLTKPFTKLKWKQLYLIGWGMNSRGAVEIALVFLAFKMGLISINLYSNLILMALITTLIFPFLFKSVIQKNPQIMN